MLSEASSDNSASSESDSETDSDSSSSSSTSGSSTSGSSASSDTSLSDSSDGGQNNHHSRSNNHVDVQSPGRSNVVKNVRPDSSLLTSTIIESDETELKATAVLSQKLSSPSSQKSQPPNTTNDHVDNAQSSPDSKPKEVFSDDHNESSLDVAPDRRRNKPTSDLKELMDNYPDVYGIRRSSRCRKEPERFAPIQADSDQSDDNRRSKRSRQRSKNSSNWDSEDSLTNESDDDSDTMTSRKNRRIVRTAAARKVPARSNTTRNLRTSRVSRKKSRHSDSSNGDYDDSVTEEEEDDDEDEDEDERIRRSTRKKVSYKEQSDHTDTDDLVEVDYGDYNAEAEEEGETIEKVLESRLGKMGAVGLPTAYFNVDAQGDPNEGAEQLDSLQKESQYLIKWKGRSHMHNTWESESSLKEQHAKGVKKIENYLRREEDLNAWRRQATPEDIEYYDCQEEMAYQLRVIHCNVERVISHQKVAGENGQEYTEYLCKFEGLPYSDCTWETEELITTKFKRKIDEYYSRNKSQRIPCRNSKVLRHRPKFVQLKQQPEYIGGKDHFKLRDYQLDGLNWLAHSWCKENSVILADEMGLGKTIQTICFFNYLSEAHGLYGPFLMVVPLSTMAAWQKEFELWAPDLNFIVYIGDVNSRNMIRTYEWCHDNSKKLKFNVLLTTYEILLKDRSFLGSVSWAVLGVDEAHRLKNDDSLLYKSLFEFDTNHRVLITGTPLQNSLRELWALLHFIMPGKFETWEEFEAEYTDCDTKGYSKLHRRLEPYLLRRVKKDVEKSLPAKVEQILRVEMTSIQKQYYKWILTKNFRALSKGMKGSYSGFANIMMELKKCCNHASLVRPTDEISSLPPLARLIRGGGKLVLLDKLLVRLKETGHRVLIFSQMVRMLDILSDYLTYRRFAFQRLDGSIKGELRKQALDHFNAENSQDFCFLLSTRAGGLGINLATADTVIIFDSDWNPQNDLQAQARAHRIGQKNQVNIYRLVTKSSVEEDIIERAKRKMVLDHLVIQRMDTTGRTVLSKSIGTSNSSNSNPFTKEELSQILKFGAEELFKEGDTGEEEPQVDIDEILKRAETREEPSATPSDELLGAFKVASFNFNEDDVNPINTQPAKPQKDWEQIIPQDERQKLEDEEKKEVEFLPPRSSRKATQQNSLNHSDSGEEYDPNGRESEDSDGDARSGRRKGRARKENGKEQLRGFSEQEIRRFIKSYKKFASPMKRLDSIAMDAELQEKPMADLKHLAEIIQSGCENAIRQHEEGLSQENLANDGQVAKKRLRGLNFKLYRVTVFPRNILSCQQELEPLEHILPPTTEERKRWVLDLKAKDVKDWDVTWTIEDDSRLLAGIYEYGVGSWESIKMDPSYGLAEKILPDGDKKPQAKQLQCRVDQLLKLIQKTVHSQRMVEEIRKPRKRQVKSASKSEVGTPEPLSGNNENDASAAKPVKPTKSNKSRTKSKELVEEGTKSSSRKSKENKKVSSKDKGGKTKEHKKKKKRKRDLNAPAMHFTANAEPTIIDGDLPPKIFEQCKEKMRPVKKSLKQLDNPDSHLSKAEQNDQIESCLLKIGRRIGECLNEISDVDLSKEWRNNLWTFVSKFTEYNPKKLYRYYKHISRKHEDKEGKTYLNANISTPTTSNSTHQVLSASNSSSRHHSSSKYSSATPASASAASGRHSYSSTFSKDYGFGEKRPNPNSHSPVKRSRMDDFSSGRDRPDPNIRIDSLRLDSTRNDLSGRLSSSDYNSGSRRPSGWHPQSASNYDSQDRYRPYSSTRPPHSGDKYHSDSRNRYGNRPSYTPSSSSSSNAPTTQSSPFYTSANHHHSKSASNSNHLHSFGSPLNTNRDNRPPDWSL